MKKEKPGRKLMETDMQRSKMGRETDVKRKDRERVG